MGDCHPSAREHGAGTLGKTTTAGGIGARAAVSGATLRLHAAQADTSVWCAAKGSVVHPSAHQTGSLIRMSTATSASILPMATMS